MARSPTRVTFPARLTALVSVIAALASNVVPVLRVSVPVPSAVLLPAASVPALRVVPPE
jgi:hypothetical protein